jgi:hypothetical protein
MPKNFATTVLPMSGKVNVPTESPESNATTSTQKRRKIAETLKSRTRKEKPSNSQWSKIRIAKLKNTWLGVWTYSHGTSSTIVCLKLTFWALWSPKETHNKKMNLLKSRFRSH